MKTKTNQTPAVAPTMCERCKQLEERANLLQHERDELMLAVARERQRANAVLLEFPTQPLVVQVQASAAKGPLPLRYRVADKVNDSVKGLLPFAHVAVKRLMGKG